MLEGGDDMERRRSPARSRLAGPHPGHMAADQMPRGTSARPGDRSEGKWQLPLSASRIPSSDRFSRRECAELAYGQPTRPVDLDYTHGAGRWGIRLPLESGPGQDRADHVERQWPRPDGPGPTGPLALAGREPGGA